MNHRRRSLPVTVLCVPLSRYIPLGHRDHPLYSVSGTMLCLLFRLSGGKILKARSTYLTSSHWREVVDVRESIWNDSETQAHPRC